MKRRWKHEMEDTEFNLDVMGGTRASHCREQRAIDGNLYPGGNWRDDKARDRVLKVICRQGPKSRWDCQGRERMRREGGLRNKHLDPIYEKCEEEGDKCYCHRVKRKTGNSHREEGWRVFWRRAWSGDKEETQIRKKYENIGCHN